MKVLMRTVLLALAAAAALAIASPRAQSKFTLKVHTDRAQTGYGSMTSMSFSPERQHPPPRR